MGKIGAVYPLGSREATNARRKFYEARKRSSTSTCKTSFEDFYNFFRNEELTIMEIARRANISRQSAGQLYETYFKGLLGGLSSFERHQALLEKRCAARRAMEQIPDVPALQLIARLAQERKLSVAPYRARDKHNRLGPIHRQSILIGSVLCMIHPIVTSRPPPPGKSQRYSVKLLSRALLDFAPVHIFPVLIKSVHVEPFIIPSKLLREVYFAGEEVEMIRLNIPLKPHIRQRTKRLNFWSHSGSWELIMPS